MTQKTIHAARSLGMLTVMAAYILLSLLSCGEEDKDWSKEVDLPVLRDSVPDNEKYYINPPYPVNADTLRILAIGSSFIDDAVTYLDTLVNASGIDNKRLCVYKLVIGFSRFNTWIDTYYSTDSVYARWVAGKVDMVWYGRFHDLLAQNWDVIIVNQASDASYQWSTFMYLPEYIDIITSACTNKEVCLAYQLHWSHTKKEMPYVLDGNILCSKKMAQDFGIDVIIPCGTAIQIARGTNLNDNMYMTRDHYHLNKGIACYIASCTWFQKLLYPVFGISVIDNPARPEGFHTDDEVLLAQQCAEYAVEHPDDYNHAIQP